jgi:trimeric autotransporter adhesin
MNKTAVFFAGLLCAGALALRAQTTSFTYQGRLADGGSPASGFYDLRFTLFDAPTNGLSLDDPFTHLEVPVTNGLFTLLLDFGLHLSNGGDRWLEISVRTNGSGGPYTALLPRQPITPAPYALHALNAANLMSFVNQPLDIKVAGVRALRIEPTTNSPNIIGGFEGNSVAPNLMGATIAGGGGILYDPDNPGVFENLPNRVEGYFSTIGGGVGNHVVPVVATIAGGQQNSIAMNASGSFIGGGFFNSVREYAGAAVIGGGDHNRVNGGYAVLGGGNDNRIDDFSWEAVLAGGLHNTIEGVAAFATISGGADNVIQTNSSRSTIGGGVANVIESDTLSALISGGSGHSIGSDSSYSTIAGGERNTIASEAWNSSIGGGEFNLIETQTDNGVIGGGVQNAIRMAADSSTIAGGEHNETTAKHATVGGGGYNIASGLGAVVAGGLSNRAGGNFSFAAGSAAEALHDGSWVWADDSPTIVPLTSTTSNQFTARAAGGVRFFTDKDATTGVELAPGAGSWSMLSDRNAKENFTRANPREVLNKLASLPLATWNYKAQNESIRHIGPVAQDFHAAFGVGEDERHISSVDADGVALAAIQGLNQKVERENRALRAELDTKEVEIQELKKGLAGLRELIEQRSSPQR